MDLTQLYQDIIVDHNRSPRNFRKQDGADHEVEGFNPLCGDKLRVYLTMDGNRISDLSFEGSGCAISVASASLMTEALIGKTRAQALEYFDQVHRMLTESDYQSDSNGLGKLAALAGVRAYPTRVKCASLCWHTAKAALDSDDTVVTTE